MVLIKELTTLGRNSDNPTIFLDKKKGGSSVQCICCIHDGLVFIRDCILVAACRYVRNVYI